MPIFKARSGAAIAHDVGEETLVAPRLGYDELGFLSYAIRSFYPASADGLH